MANTIAGVICDSPTRCAVLKIDLKSRFVYVDDETEEILGIAPEQLFGRSIYDFISDSSVQNLDRILNCHNRYESFYQALPLMIRVNESEFKQFDAVVTLNFIGGNPVNYQFILVPQPMKEDASGIKIDSPPVQPSLGDNLDLLGQAADSLQIGVLIVDNENTILLQNQTLGRLSNPDHEPKEMDFEVVYKRLMFCHPAEKKISFEESVFAQTVNGRIPVSADYFCGEFQKRVKILGAPLDMADTTVFVFYFLPDELIGENTSALPIAAKKLLSSVAHDVRAPLVTIDAFTQRLRKKHADSLNKDGLFALNCLAENTKILNGMVDGLAEITNNWETKHKSEKIILPDLISEQIELLKAAYPDTDFSIIITDPLPNIIAPKRMIVQLFKNMLDNAFKYSRGVAKPTITIRYSRDCEYQRFTISDNGPGISGNYRRKIFEPFFRIPEDTTRETSGTGLGLTIVNDIVTSWGGTIRLDRSKGHGATFIITLPLRLGG